ncbi:MULTISPECIES: T9SS type A sorting domain-containing protein [Chryseobacterium]|uniref:T9SS type A sorting domain-containing protein n=1 Tax=Chryseobacterium sp. R2A-55 TaxID=2744445 RepID=UPI001F2000F9|nr:T9SS type A sorting domain-containing protein [Chryseobacterium sp. R2A-55]
MKKSVLISFLVLLGSGVTAESAAQQAKSKSIRSVQTANVATANRGNLNLSETEIVEKRAQNVKHFRNSDGTFTAQIGGNYHYKDAQGKWQDINLNIQASNSGFSNVTNEVKSFFPKNAASTSGVKMQLPNGDQFVWWKNQQIKIGGQIYKPTAANGTVKNEKLTYSNLYNKISEEFVILENGMENNIILHSKTPEIEALSPNSAMEFSYFIPLQNSWKIMNADGQQMTSNFTSSNFSVQLSGQDSNIYFGKTIVFDNAISRDEAMKLNFPVEKITSGEKTQLDQHALLLSYQIQFLNGGVQVTTALPASWLKANHRSYPITIDPEVTVTPTGAAGTFYGALTHWYGYQRHATVYLQSEIGVYGTITDIEYNSTNAGTAGSRPTKVYMKTTSNSVLAADAWNSSNYTGGAQLCLDANTDQGNTAGWKKLTLTTPFNYDQGNLVVMVYDAWGGGGATKHYNQANGTAFSNRQAYKRTDNTDPGDASALALENRVSEIRITYIPTAACTTLPASVTATSSVSNTCPSNPFTLTASGLPIESGLSIQWQQSTDGGTNWTNLGTPQTGSTYLVSAGITSNTQFKATITCVPSSAQVISSVVNVTVKPISQCYCTNAIPFQCNDGDLITNVTIGTINNNSSCSTSTGGYSDYTTSGPSTDLVRGATVPISVTVGPSGDGWLYESVGAWIDYNQNGIFEASELTVIGTGLNQAINGNITIPGTALLGPTRMRVMVLASQNPVSQEYACGPIAANNPFGEMEDYTVNIVSTMATNEANEMKAVQIYPNPANTELFVDLANQKNGSLEIYTADGRFVISYDLSSKVNKLDVSKLEPGMYMVKITSGEGVVTRKLMKK